MGCSDQGHPEVYSEVELSLLQHFMETAFLLGISKSAAFGLVPDAMKMEFNHSNWKYINTLGLTNNR